MKTEAEKQLAKLVSMPTLSDDTGANEQALDYIENYLRERGMFCRRDNFDGHGTLVASSRRDNAKTPSVLLAGHVDVMTGSEQMFSLRVDGDKLIGRGVYDMKFAIAGYMQLVDELKGHLERYDFAIMVTTDEEYGGRDNINGSARLVEAGYRPKVCILPDSAAPGWDIETLAKGYWRFDLIAEGRTAHGSRPWEGDSASFKLIQALHEIKEQFKDHGPDTDTLNIGVIHGGETYNQIPAYMMACVEVRVMSDESQKRISDMIDKSCEKHGLSIQKRVYGVPVKTDPSNPYVKSFMESIRSVTNRHPNEVTSYAASDSPYFSGAGIPCIVSCPEGGAHHSENEWISRKSFAQFVPILNNYLDKTALKTPGLQVDNNLQLV